MITKAILLLLAHSQNSGCHSIWIFIAIMRYIALIQPRLIANLSIGILISLHNLVIGLVPLFNGMSTFVVYLMLKSSFVELCLYYLIHTWGDKGVYSFS